MENKTQETLEMLKGVFEKAAAITQSTGLVNYDLSAVAKTLYAVPTPLRNRLPRVMGQGDTATRWMAILSPDNSGASAVVSEGARAANIGVAVTPYTAAYAGLGKESSVSFEADFAAVGFDDAKARAVEAQLRSLMIEEEKMLLGGNASMALGTPAQPVAVPVAGGSMTPLTALVFVCALTPEGLANASIAGGVKQVISRSNADGTSTSINGGSSQISAASAGVTVGTSNLSLSASVTPIVGAAGYAWFVGAAAGTAKLAAITTINSMLITADPAGTQVATAVTADCSKNLLAFDGFLTQALKNGVGYFNALATGTNGTGTKLTSDGAGGIVEFDAALAWFYDQYRLSPQRILVSSQEAAAVNKLVIANGGAPLVRFNMDAAGGHAVTGSGGVTQYFNKFSANENPLLSVELHPNMPKGTVLFVTDQLPYPIANVPGVAQVKARKDYYQIEWPMRSRQYEYGVYTDEVLQVFAPFALGVISNIAK